MSSGTQTFEYNGRMVTTSTPVKALKTVKKTLLIDSADRDTTKYYTNGDFVVYLPRVYENVVSMRLAAAEFPQLVGSSPAVVSCAINTISQSSGGVSTVTLTGGTGTTGMNPGNSVLIYTGTAGLTSFNGTYSILTVPSATTFTIPTSPITLDTTKLTLVSTSATFTYTGIPALVNGQTIITSSIVGGNIAAATYTVATVSGNSFNFNGVSSSSATTIAGTFTLGAIYVSGSPLATIQTPGARTHQFTYGQTNLSSTTFTNDAVVPSGTYYFLLDVEGMNKVDELAVGGNKSTFVDSYFAKIPALSAAYNSGTFIEYNDHAQQENIARYSPAIGKLDRLHIRTRLHNQKDSNIGVLYWTTDGNYAGASTNTGANYNLTLEIEYLDNVFDDFSALETHLTSRT